MCFSGRAYGAQAPTVCGSGNISSLNYNWCATGASTTRVLYYLHGNGESERSWGTPAHRALENAMGSERPTVIALSFGPTWFVTNRLSQVITSTIMPEIEGRLSLQPQRRWLFGESMGGFNALQLYNFAPDSFHRFAAACPALLSFAPQASHAEIEAFLARHRPYVMPNLVYKWRDKLLRVYPDSRTWAEHDPLRWATSKTPQSPPLFVHAQGADVFAFQEGTQILVDKLTAAGAPHEYHFNAGAAHCQTDAPTQAALATFLAH